MLVPVSSGACSLLEPGERRSLRPPTLAATIRVSSVVPGCLCACRRRHRDGRVAKLWRWWCLCSFPRSSHLNESSFCARFSCSRGMLLHLPNHCWGMATPVAMPLLTAGHPLCSWRNLLETQLYPNWWQEKDGVWHMHLSFSPGRCLYPISNRACHAGHGTTWRVWDPLLWDAMDVCLGRRHSTFL